MPSLCYTQTECPALQAPAPGLQGAMQEEVCLCHCVRSAARGKEVQEPRRLTASDLCPLRGPSTMERPASPHTPQASPESRQLLGGPATAGPGRGTSEGPSASDSVVREPTSETSPSSPSVLCRRGLRCQFWMAWRRRPELRGGWARSEPPLAALWLAPKPPGPLSSGAPSSGRGSSRLSLS